VTFGLLSLSRATFWGRVFPKLNMMNFAIVGCFFLRQSHFTKKGIAIFRKFIPPSSISARGTLHCPKLLQSSCLTSEEPGFSKSATLPYQNRDLYVGLLEFVCAGSYRIWTTWRPVRLSFEKRLSKTWPTNVVALQKHKI
jgi:hypothetical protein